MPTRRLLSLLLAVAVVALASVARAQQPSNAPPSATVEVLGIDGKPVPNCPVSIADREAPFADAVTDASGRAQLVIAGRNPEELVVSLGFAPAAISVTAKMRDQTAYTRTLYELRQRGAFEPMVPLRTGPDGSRVATLQAKPVTSVTLAGVSGADGLACEGELLTGRHSLPATATCSDRKVARLQGVPFGVADTIYVARRATVLPVDLTAERTSRGEVALEPVVFPPAAKSGTLTLRLSGGDRVTDKTRHPLTLGVTLVAEDGSRFYRYSTLGHPSSETTVVNAVARSEKPRFEMPPSGRYYLTAGCLLNGLHDAVDLRAFILGGGKPGQAGIPSIEIVEGTEMTFDVDLAACRAALTKALALPTAKPATAPDAPAPNAR